VARVTPQPLPAGAALVGRIGAEARELAIGQCFAADAEQPHRHGGRDPRGVAGGRIARNRQERQREQHHQQGLGHEEPEDLSLVAFPVPAQVAVAAILVFTAHAVPEVQGEPAAPQATQHGQCDARLQCAIAQPGQQQCAGRHALGPQHVDHADVVVAALPSPAPAHHQHRVEQHPAKQVHARAPL